jgi:hypothetical protein
MGRLIVGVAMPMVDVCHQFARHAGYKKTRPWATDQQKIAREIYRGKGYVTPLLLTSVENFYSWK